MKQGALRWLFGLALAIVSLAASAQYVPPYVTVQGYLTTSGGTPAKNATLTFELSQVAFVAGTQVVVQESQCASDVSGNVVEIGNPASLPIVTPQLVGTLPPGSYYVKFTWYDQWGDETLPSNEVAVTLSGTGELHVTPPAGTGPPNAVGMNVFISGSPGTEIYQGHTTTPTATFTQAAPLTTGRLPSISNTTVCRVVANDSMWPTGTGYNVSLLDASGNTLFAYPQMWQFLGAGYSYNLSQGIPYYHGQVTYPVPILTTPYNHNIQSISGPLAMGLPGNYYPIVGVQSLGVDTMLPAWGIDVEGSGLLGVINAAGGYLINGSGGTTGQAPCSDGTAIDQLCTFVSSLPAFFYQTVLDGATVGSAVTQRSYLSFGSGTGLVATDHVGVGPLPGRTTVSVNTQADLSSYPFIPASLGGEAAGHFACWAGPGTIVDSTAPCASGLRVVATTGVFTTCVMVGHSSTDVSCSGTQAWLQSISGSYFPLCMNYTAGVDWNTTADTNGITRFVVGATALTGSTVAYYESSLQGGATGATTQAYCMAFQ